MLRVNLYIESTWSTIAIYSPYGDADIIALAVTLLSEYKERVILKKQEQISSGIIELEDSPQALTSNDFLSSFFRRGKKKFCRIVKKIWIS